MLDFEWDEQKAAANLAKHGVSFSDASAIFNDPFALDIEEWSMNYGEVRRRIIGLGNGRHLTVIYTERGDTIRLISARKATRIERREYEDAKW
ncbi:BrnT family toxin [Rhizobium sp. GN54]|uniref:BrnT family toxin n=1 Tax=Rhizobium sp. GN54 TaxID=2898150 RepID=UPI001E637CDB|nr:BrnT family toxin [Rhizobium sp. GN54]MCD2181462.1 BrnT family toxin [Rhizobium sp. GN54]